MANAYAREEAAFFWVFVEAVGRQFIFEVTPGEVGVSEIVDDELPFTGHDEATEDFSGALRWAVGRIAAGPC